MQGHRASRLQTRLRSLAAEITRALLHLRTLKSKRAQGRPGADRHPRSAARNAHAGRTAQQHTGDADHSAFPARWSDGLCRALPGAELSFGLPRRSNWMMPSTRLGSRASSIRLDRSNDGQDHTVLPYARPAMSPAVFPALYTEPETYRRDEPSSAVVRTKLGLTGTTRPARASRADAAASTASPARDQDDDEIAPLGEPGWTTHTPKPNFGKVEYFRSEGLTEGDTGKVP